MKYVRSGARIGVLCPMVLVVVIWIIQFATFVLVPDRGGPDWTGFVFSMALTLVWVSPLLIVGAVIGAIVGAVTGALATGFSSWAMPRSGEHGRAERGDPVDSR